MERSSGVEQGLGLGPAEKGRGSTSRGVPLECGVLEFGGKTLGEGVWVGFRPIAVGGVLRGCLQVPSVEVRPWVGMQGQGLASAQQEGGSESRGLGPGAQQATRCTSGRGKP